MNADLREVLIDALGIGWRIRGATHRTSWRNRTACNLRNDRTCSAHSQGVLLGLLVPDPAEHYGMMRVFRVTDAGALAVTGKKLPKKLAALIPAPEEQAEPERLAA